MEKLKNWLKPTKNKVIFGIIVTVLLISSGVGIYALTKNAPDPVIVFNKNISIEYGRTSMEVDDESIVIEELPIITIAEIVNEELSDYDEISFNKIGVGSEPMTMEYRFISADEVGEQTGTLYARLGEVVKEFEFNFTVVDTHSPVIEGLETIRVDFSVAPDYSHINAKDIVDGDVAVSINDYNLDVNKAGEYEVVATATDKNGNETKETFKVIVKEEVIEVIETPSSSSGNNNNSSSSNGSNGNSSNNNSGRNSDSGNNNSGGGSSNTPSQPDLGETEEEGCITNGFQTICGGTGTPPWEVND